MKLSIIFTFVLLGNVAFGQEAAKLKWLKKQAIPFKTVEAGKGLEDLRALKKVIGDARIVSLGESTHGSREIFQMKHRLVEWLATEMGFTIFSIEASMPEAYRVNDYVLTGKGDPSQLIRGMHFWTWSTEEVRDMVQWMRKFNQQGKGRIEFTGFDMQFPEMASKNVLTFLKKANQDLHQSTKAAYDKVTSAQRAPAGSGFAVATGSFPIDKARGKKLTFTGWIKTENIKTGYAGLWWRVDGPKSKLLAFDNMSSQRIRGTTDWKKYSFELTIPKEAVNINFGVLKTGDGQAWFDELEIKLDGRVYKDPKLFDFTFESATLKGLVTFPSRTNRAEIDKTVAKTGKHSLRLSTTAAPAAKGIEAGEAHKLALEVLKKLEKSRADLVKKHRKKEVEWAIQNARIVAQCMEMRSNRRSAVRDRSMAENVAWILEQNPKAKIILWAHNGHIAKQPNAMGQFLDKKFGKKHLAVGFATSEGEYQAIGKGGLGNHKLQAPPAGSAELLFQKTEMPRFILDLRTVDASAEGSGWLAKLVQFRQIGALAMDQQFGRANLARQFDLMIYIKKTTAAQPLKR